MSCNDGSVARVIRETRPNADVVIVFPHWGVEYYPKPRTYQREQAAQWMEAGADLVIGAHSHFPGGMEDIDGNLVMYSMGNFIFDQDFRQATMMGLVPEMTFNGSELKQVWLHTTLDRRCAAEPGQSRHGRPVRLRPGARRLARRCSTTSSATPPRPALAQTGEQVVLGQADADARLLERELLGRHQLAPIVGGECQEEAVARQLGHVLAQGGVLGVDEVGHVKDAS